MTVENQYYVEVRHGADGSRTYTTRLARGDESPVFKSHAEAIHVASHLAWQAKELGLPARWRSGFATNGGEVWDEAQEAKLQPTAPPSMAGRPGRPWVRR